MPSELRVVDEPSEKEELGGVRLKNLENVEAGQNAAFLNIELVIS